MNAEMKEFLDAIGKQLVPMVDVAVKAAVTANAPAIAVVVDPVIDAIDSYITGLLSGGTAPAVTAPTDTESRVAALEKHVAALTVATGHGTSAALPTLKATTVTPAESVH